MNTHKTEPKTPVFLTDLIYLLVGEVCPKSTTDKEFTCKCDNSFEFFKTVNISEVN